jgi:hypothetical protein
MAVGSSLMASSSHATGSSPSTLARVKQAGRANGDASRGTGRKVYCALTWPDRWMDGMGARVIEDWKLGVYKYMLYLGSLNQLRSQASAESDLLCSVNVCLRSLWILEASP